MAVDGTLNPSGHYIEESNDAHTAPGGRYQVVRGYKEAWAITDPIAYRAPMTQAEADAAIARGEVVFYTGVDTRASVPPTP